jgi:hypothetical protein
VLCDRPVAAKGEVAGFDFDGFHIRKALPDNFACPELANAVTDACLGLGGRTAFDKSCAVLCDRPVARSR